MIVLFSILFGLYLTKQFGPILKLQFWLKKTLKKDRAKPFDCTACTAFWVSIGCLWCAYYNVGLLWPGWGGAVMTAVTSYTGGSFIEAVWRKI